MRFSFLALLTLASSTTYAATIKKFGGQDTMNGYSVKALGNFPKSWHLVTVRFRKDSQEMRFTYANDIAWKAITGGKISYPDGSAFTKIGIASEDDPAFVSSVVPHGARRYQLMVKNSRKHRSTAGWGYALFNEKGLTYDEDPKLQEQACAACHSLVANRDSVFSQWLDLTPTFSVAPKKSVPAEFKFKILAYDNFPAAIKLILGDGFKKMFIVDGALRDFVFQGTLDEIKPTLEKKSAESGLPAALISSKGDRFSLIFPDKNAPPCNANKEILLKSFVSTKEGRGSIETTFCYAR